MMEKQKKTDLTEQFISLFGVPAFVKTYLHHIVSREEMRLVVLLGGKWLAESEIASKLSLPEAEIRILLESAYQRMVINRRIEKDVISYQASDFYRRLDQYCKFGNYYILPSRIRNKLDQWCFQEYLRRNDNFEQAVAGRSGYLDRYSEAILLLTEAEELVMMAPVIRVVPCNCKMLADGCDHSREICLVLDPDRVDQRTGGRELTREEAKDMLRKLDREGLIHTAPYNWLETGKGYICNCCPCCCYPLRAARLLGTKGRWPLSRYRASYDSAHCQACGHCVRRCPFGAFQEREKGVITFSQELCWGCGLCVTGCRQGAIKMEPISPSS